MQQNAQNNVVVVKTDGYDYDETAGNYNSLYIIYYNKLLYIIIIS